MLKKSTLRTQLNISFSALILLMVIVAVVGGVGLYNGQDNFVNYRGLARDTNLAGRLQANMLLTRLNVLKYINKSEQKTLDEYNSRVGKMDAFLQEAKMEIQSPKRAPLVAKSIELVEKYKKGFSQVVSLIATRNEVVKTNLDPSGLKMRQIMTDIMEEAKLSNNIQNLYLAAKAQEALLLGRLYVVKFLVSNTAKDYKRAKKELTEHISENVKSLEAVLKTETGKNLLVDFKKSYNLYITSLDQVYATITDRNNIINSTLNVIGPEVADDIEKVKLSVKGEQDELGPLAQSTAENSLTAVEIIAAINLIIGCLAGYFLPRIIREPIGGEPLEIANITEKIADGDLTIESGEKESMTGILASIMNMSANLRKLISNIVATGNSITSSASNSAKIADQTSSALLEQKGRTAEVASSITDMSNSLSTMVDISNQSAESATEAQKQTVIGKGIVDSTLVSVKSLAQRVEGSVLTMQELEKSSVEIGSVIEVIKNISEQTNLLALNAAIEAARAGEQGRGFAVVADEVRNLAQRTQESTTVIQTTVESLQAGTQKAVTSLVESGKEAHSMVEKSVETGQALDSVLETINQISEMNADVAKSVKSQSIVVNEIQENIAAISESSDITSDAAIDAAKLAQELSCFASDLQTSVKGFKIT